MNNNRNFELYQKIKTNVQRYHNSNTNQGQRLMKNNLTNEKSYLRSRLIIKSFVRSIGRKHCLISSGLKNLKIGSWRNYPIIKFLKKKSIKQEHINIFPKCSKEMKMVKKKKKYVKISFLLFMIKCI